jgi:hypothetical protein
MANKTPPHPSRADGWHDQDRHEWDPPTPLAIKENRILQERIARERNPTNPVAGHGEPEPENDPGRKQARRRRR